MIHIGYNGAKGHLYIYVLFTAPKMYSCRKTQTNVVLNINGATDFG